MFKKILSTSFSVFLLFYTNFCHAQRGAWEDPDGEYISLDRQFNFVLRFSLLIFIIWVVYHLIKPKEKKDIIPEKKQQEKSKNSTVNKTTWEKLKEEKNLKTDLDLMRHLAKMEREQSIFNNKKKEQPFKEFLHDMAFKMLMAILIIIGLSFAYFIISNFIKALSN